MNSTGSREELQGMGFQFERREKCRGKSCGATIELWRKVPGPMIAFRVALRSGKLFQHAAECPDAKRVKKNPVEEKISRPVKPKKKELEQARLF